jgi:hypothetical protein
MAINTPQVPIPPYPPYDEPPGAIDSLFNLIEAIREAQKGEWDKERLIMAESGQRYCDTLPEYPIGG